MILNGVVRPEQKGGPNMVELMHQMRRLLLNLFKLAREIRMLAYEYINLLVTWQGRYFRWWARAPGSKLKQTHTVGAC